MLQKAILILQVIITSIVDFGVNGQIQENYQLRLPNGQFGQNIPQYGQYAQNNPQQYGKSYLGQNYPSQNIQNYPSQNSQNYPSQNIQNYPSQNSQNYPSQNIQNYPSQNSQNYPSQNIQNYQSQNYPSQDSANYAALREYFPEQPHFRQDSSHDNVPPDGQGEGQGQPKPGPGQSKGEGAPASEDAGMDESLLEGADLTGQNVEEEVKKKYGRPPKPELTTIPESDILAALQIEVGTYSPFVDEFKYYNSQSMWNYSRGLVMEYWRCNGDYMKCLTDMAVPQHICTYYHYEKESGVRTMDSTCDFYHKECLRGYRKYKIIGLGMCFTGDGYWYFKTLTFQRRMLNNKWIGRVVAPFKFTFDINGNSIIDDDTGARGRS